MAEKTERTCVRCHFIFETRDEDNPQPRELDEHRRAKIQADERQGILYLACFEGAWNEVTSNKLMPPDELLRNRPECDMFLGYLPGYSFKAGEPLRELRAEKERTEQAKKRDEERNSLMVKGLFLSAIGLILTGICSFLSVAERLWEYFNVRGAP